MSDCQGWRKHSLDIRQLDLYFSYHYFEFAFNFTLVFVFLICILNFVTAAKER